MNVALFPGVSRVEAAPAAGRRSGSIVHAVTSRSAAARLAPVRDALAALEAPQASLDLRGVAPADVARRLEAVAPGLLLVADDGDAAVAAALAAQRAGLGVGRLGAGLRSGDRAEPQEINRLVLDGVADRLFTDTEEAAGVLAAEGVAAERVTWAGSTLADRVHGERGAAAVRAAWRDVSVLPGRYVLVALQRAHPGLPAALRALAARIAVVVAEPERPYRDFLSLQMGARAVVTDSAAVQEETTLLGIPCFTLRRSSERVATLLQGTNRLLGDDPAALAELPLDAPRLRLVRIARWDGRAGARVATSLAAGV